MRIEGSDGENVAVTIVDGWVERVGQDLKPVVKITGQDEKGRTGTTTLWMTDDIRGKDTQSSIEKALEQLEHLGMEDGNFLNFPDWVASRPAVTFFLSVKENEGKTTTNYYLRSPVVKIDIAEAAELFEQIRGKAAANSAAIRGEPIDGDGEMDWN